MNRSDRILYAIMQNLDGLQKAEVVDIIFRIEMLLKMVEDPINVKNLEHTIFAKTIERPNENKFYKVILNGREYIRIDHSDFMHLFVRSKSGIGNLFFEQLYFKKTLSSESLILFNKKNIRLAYRHTTYEGVINNFINNNNINTKDSVSNRYKILLIED